MTGQSYDNETFIVEESGIGTRYDQYTALVSLISSNRYWKIARDLLGLKPTRPACGV